MSESVTLTYKVGPGGPDTDGAEVLYPRTDRFHSLRIAQAGGEYEEMAARGELFYAATQAAVTWDTLLELAAQTLTLYNPVGSAFDLVLLEVGIAIKTLSAGGHFVLAANVNNAAAAVTFASTVAVRNAKLDGAAGVGVASISCTLPAIPVAIRTCAYGITTPTVAHQIVDRVKGAVIVAPNTAVTLQTITAAGTGLVSFLWRERKRVPA